MSRRAITESISSKSLLFFDDAEKDPMPHMLVPLDWDAVKVFFTDEVPELI